jgi:hypothetical protein
MPRYTLTEDGTLKHSVEHTGDARSYQVIFLEKGRRTRFLTHVARFEDFGWAAVVGASVTLNNVNFTFRVDDCFHERKYPGPYCCDERGQALKSKDELCNKVVRGALEK